MRLVRRGGGELSGEGGGSSIMGGTGSVDREDGEIGGLGGSNGKGDGPSPNYVLSHVGR